MLIRDSKRFQLLNEGNEHNNGGFTHRVGKVYPPLDRIAKDGRIIKGRMKLSIPFSKVP